MKNRNRYIAVALVLWISGKGFGQQNPEAGRQFETIIESVTDGQEDDADYQSMLEGLEELYENPLNLNSADEEGLKKLVLLNDFQIANLLKYRSENGEMYSVYELNSIEGFSREILEKIEPFVYFGPPGEKRKDSGRSRHQVLARATRVVQKSEEYESENGEPPKYEGNPYRFYSRYRFSYGEKIEAGFTTEKDPGEAFFAGSNTNGFDFYSGNICLRANAVLKNITVGDFQARSGQGLVLWQGFSVGKSADVLNVARNSQGLKPYTSSDENRFFRGCALDFQFRNVSASVFFSSKKVDANTEMSDLPGSRYFTGLQVSGLHRTENEISDERSVHETSAGAIFSYRKDRLQLGSVVLLQRFEFPLIRDNVPYNLYRFSGRQNLNFGTDYRYISGNYQFFGEAAASRSGGFAILQGVSANLHSQASFTLLFRHFGKNYQTLTGSAFAEGSSVSNETGLYLGSRILPARNLKISAYSDFYRTPWITYTTFAPASGFDVFAQADYSPSKKWAIYLRLKNEEKEIKTTENEKYVNTDLIVRRARFHFDFRLNNVLTLKSRAELSFYKKMAGESGFMIYQDISWNPQLQPFKASFRVAYFHTGSYNTAIYTYENDLLYNYSINALYGKGFRFYINLNYSVSEKITLYFKVADSVFPDGSPSGSDDLKNGTQSLTEVKIQARINF